MFAGVESVYLVHQGDIVELVDLNTLVPVLNRLRLLTVEQNSCLLQTLQSPQERKRQLAKFLCTKGDKGYRLFLQALQEEQQHIGHRQLYERLPPLQAFQQSEFLLRLAPQHVLFICLCFNLCITMYKCSQLQISFTAGSLQQGRSGQESICLDPEVKLKRHLEDYYQTETLFSLVAGPYIQPSEFIRLALIKEGKVTAKQIEQDEFLRHTLHGHIDDIRLVKSKLKIEEIMKKQKKECLKVLVEGAPGIGKTMLAIHLCQQWAKRKLLQEYDLVLLVPLRRFSAEDSKGLKVKNLIEMYLPESKNEVACSLEKTGGRKVLIILEGWDELPPKLRDEFTLFRDIITGIKLPKASVIITSRPTLASELYRLVQRRVEVLGFEMEQIRDYLITHLPNPDGKHCFAGEILGFLECHPHIKALSHIPLTLAIICSIFKRNQSSLPETLTELYAEYLYEVLLDNLGREDGKRESLRAMTREAIFSLAESILCPLRKLALDGFQKRKFVFTAEDLRRQDLQPYSRFDGHGLLTPIPSFRRPVTKQSSDEDDSELLYQFRHLTVQEFLAAQRIQELEAAEQTRLLSVHRNDKQFYNTWKFLAGITSLKDKYLRDSVISSTNDRNSKDLLFLLHCLYEAHNREVCTAAADKLNNKLDFSNTSLNPTDCLCAAYTVISAGGDWELIFRGSHIGAAGLATLKEHLEKAYSECLKFEKGYHLRISDLE